MNINPAISSAATASVRGANLPVSAFSAALTCTKNVTLSLSRRDSLLNVSMPESVDSRFSSLLSQELTFIGNLLLRRSNRPDLAHKDNGSIHAARYAISNKLIATEKNSENP